MIEVGYVLVALAAFGAAAVTAICAAAYYTMELIDIIRGEQ